MPSKTPISTSKAPNSAHLSQAIVAGGMVYCSGAVPVDVETMTVVEGDIQVHTHKCIQNLGAVLKAAGSDLSKVVKVNVFLASMDDFAKMNEVYMTYWGDVKPCRTCVAVKTLPRNTDVEIECIACL